MTSRQIETVQINHTFSEKYSRYKIYEERKYYLLKEVF